MMTAVDAALSAGYRLFDTAKFYFNEVDLGEALEVIFSLVKQIISLILNIGTTSSTPSGHLEA